MLGESTLMFNPETAPYYPVFLREFGANAIPLAVTLSATPVRDGEEIETAVTTFAREPAGALIAAPDPFINTQRASIIALAERHHLPTLFGFRQHARDGGLMSYGPNSVISSAVRLPTSIAFSGARSPPTCRCSRQPGTNSSSTLGPLRPLALSFRHP